MFVGEKTKSILGYDLEIVAIRNVRDIDVLVDNKYIRKNVTYGNFKKGSVRSPYLPLLCGIGYIGVGEYKSKNKDGSINEAYQKWNDMMKRCYSETSLKIRKTYEHVNVCEEWHNFQNFAKWFYENRIDTDEEIHIDKDIINGESNLYSPETCCIVPKTINGLFIRCKKLNKENNVLPVGVIKRGTKYSAQLSADKGRIRKYGFNTPEEAFQWYKEEKEKHIKDIANRYKNVLPQRTYYALVNYEVKPYPFTEEELVS